MAAAGLREKLAASRRRVAWVAMALVLVAGLLWMLLYGTERLKAGWMQRNEARARQTLATITTALRAYQEKYDAYPDSLERLRGKEEGHPETAPPERARLLETPLARDRFEKDGYRFRFRPGQPEQRWAATVQLFSSYRLTAKPLAPGGSGEWFYYTDQSGQLRARRGKPAGPDDPVVD